MDTTRGADYVTINGTNSFKFVKEPLDTKQTGAMMDKYTKDLSHLVGELKIQLQPTESLRNNTKIGEIVQKIQEKIDSYRVIMIPIDENCLKITGYIEQMESLYKDSRINLRFSGSTCVSVLIVGTKVFCANVGDSRAVLVRSLQAPME